MTIFSVLKQEHRTIDGLFAELDDLRNGGDEKKQQKLFMTMKQELLAHAQAEHKSLYDRLIDEPATHEVVKRSEHEHEIVERLIKEMDELDMTSAMWFEKLDEIKKHINEHVQEEENVIFPRAKAILEKNEQVEIADDYRDRKFYLLENFV